MPKAPLLILLLTVATYAQTSLHDKRDGKTYKTVKIGTQIWMAENLNYDAENSKCYENKPENCEKYGRLYDWETAMKACPYGWHLPSDKEWQVLVNFAGGKKVAGKKLKAKSGWNSYEGKSGNGMDEYGFSALPGGHCNVNLGSLHFYNVGYFGLWRSATEAGSNYTYQLSMSNVFEYTELYDVGKVGLTSVRCVKD